MKISLVLVGYFSSARLPDCIRSFRHEAERVGIESEIVCVDHSEDEQETSKLRVLGIDRLISQPNGGYAVGLNRGARESRAEILFLANPDILFLEKSVISLLQALENGWTIVGPQLYWDRSGEILLPPPDDPSPIREIQRRLRAASFSYWKRSLGAELDRVFRFWSVGPPVEAPSLRGPLLVMERTDWEKYGPMDEGYFLYFEETEFLLRARSRGARLGLVRDAGLVHEWGHATLGSSKAADREQLSRLRFFRRNYPIGSLVLKLIRQDPVFPFEKFAIEPGGMEVMRRSGGDLWLFSPFDHLHPAAGWIGDRPWPSNASRLFGEGRWHGLSVCGSPGSWTTRGPWSWGES